MRELWRQAVERHGTGLEVVVAEAEGELVGAVVGKPGALESMFVVPRCWGTGVADRLHDAAVDVSRRAGSALCRLEVLEENRRARRFYERRGWLPDGRRRAGEFPPHPVVLGYSLSLTGSPGVTAARSDPSR